MKAPASPWSPLLITALALAASFASPELRCQESYQIEKRVTPSGFEDEARFLELLKYAKPPEREFHVEDAPRWDIDALKRYLPDGKISFTDVNDSSHVEETGRVVEASLRGRKGHAFEVLSHLSHIYSIPYRQYSELHFSSPSSNTSVVQVSGWYRLTFQRTAAGAKLIRIDYLELEGE